jgi:hypothetical protein
VVHFSRGPDVVVRSDDREFLFGEDGGGFFEGPGEVVSIVVQADICVLAGSISTFCVRQHLADPAYYSAGYLRVLLGTERRMGVEVGSEQFRIVVTHLLEVGDNPLRIDTVAVKSPTELVVDPAPSHTLKGPLHDVAGPRFSGAVPPRQEKPKSRRVGEFGLGTEAPIPRIEHPCDTLSGVGEQSLARLARHGFIKVLLQDAPDGVRLAQDLLPLIAIDPQNLFEN